MSEREIHSLLARYCELIDAADFDGVGELFRNGSLADEHGNVFARGADEVTAYFRDHIVLYDGSPRTKHLVLNVVIDDEWDRNVVARSSFVVLQALDDLSLQPIVTGRYRDFFVRDTRGVWRFEQRRYALDLSGDLSRHLR